MGEKSEMFWLHETEWKAERFPEKKLVVDLRLSNKARAKDSYKQKWALHIWKRIYCFHIINNVN